MNGNISLLFHDNLICSNDPVPEYTMVCAANIWQLYILRTVPYKNNCIEASLTE